MEAVARASCGSCKEPLVYLIWHKGVRLLVVQCHECGQENHYTLDVLIDALGSQDVYQTMLESFHPTGRPS